MIRHTQTSIVSKNDGIYFNLFIVIINNQQKENSLREKLLSFPLISVPTTNAPR